MEIFNKLTHTSDVLSLPNNNKSIKSKIRLKSQKYISQSKVKYISTIFYILIFFQIIFGFYVFSLDIDFELDLPSTDDETIDCKIDNCKICKNQTHCGECDEKYFLEKNICKQCPQNCLELDSDKCHCKTCEDGKYVDEKRECSDCDNNCTTCLGSSTMCTSCKNGYYVSNQINKKNCLPCITNCTTCSAKDICSECNDGFYKDNDNNKCPKCGSNCTKCEISANNCTACDSQHFLYEDEHICYDCPINECKEKGTDCRCNKCWSGFELNKGKCNQCTITNCSKYNDNTCICITCDKGYYVNNETNTCEKCNDTVCKECKEHPTKCTDCKEGYFLENNQCLECTDCKEWQDGTCKCKSCNEGYYLYKQNQCIECDSNCKECESSAVQCTDCKNGYFLDKFKCYSCYPKCKKCYGESSDINSQRCKECIDNYILFDNNNCIDKCPDGYYEEDKTCSQCNQLCKTSSENNCNQCTSCNEGYYLIKKDYKCEKCNLHCKTCIGASTVENENCLTCDINSEYKYYVNAKGFGNNCVKQCPEGTELNNNDGLTCILPKQKQDETSGNNSSNSLSVAFSIIGAIVGIFFVLVVIYYCLKRKRKINLVNKADDKLIEEINKDLKLYQSFT